MNQTVVSRKNRKKQSPFEKLWSTAIKKKAGNEQLRAELADIVQRLNREVLPREIEMSRNQQPLLLKLLNLGQRKSLTNWERDTLDDWISSLMGDLDQAGQLDEQVLEYFARYNAFRMGIELDADASAREQLSTIMRETEERIEREQQEENEFYEQEMQSERERMIEQAKAEIERTLNRKLGKRPELPDSQTDDLWADELHQAAHMAQREYDEKRETLRAEMLDERLKEIEQQFIDVDDIDDDWGDDEFLDWLFGDDDGRPHRETPPAAAESAAPLTNDTFQHLFRATAAKLHPDREPNAELRAEKQKLMATLLKARKNGDLLTVLELYETWVGKHEGFSKKDEKALLATLQAWIDKLEQEKDEIINESSLHHHAYHRFYHRSKKRVSQAITKRLADIDDANSGIAMMVKEITSLKALKPWLSERYDRGMRYMPF